MIPTYSTMYPPDIVFPMHPLGVDMIRKLLLVGMLVTFGRGSVAQLFIAIGVSFACFTLQVHFAPYKHKEDNLFKIAIELQIALTIVIALVLKSLEYQESSSTEVERNDARIYDYLLIISFVLCVPVCFVWTIIVKRKMMRKIMNSLEDGASTIELDDTLSSKRRSIHLLQLGLASSEDLKALAQYFGRLDAMVNKWSHVFISYRVASDRQLARRLYDLLTDMTLDDTGQKLRVYLDQTRLEDGQRWDSGFMEGLANAWVFVPIVSVGAVGPMCQLGGGGDGGEDWTDNVLLEWTAALELHQRGRMKAVLPLLVGESDFFADAHMAFGGIQALPANPSSATMEKGVMHLGETTGDDSIAQLRELLRQVSGQSEPTIQATLSALLRFQGVKLSQGSQLSHGHGHLSVGMDDLDECTRRVQETVSSCMKRIGSEIDSDDQRTASLRKSSTRMSRLRKSVRSQPPLAEDDDPSAWSTRPSSHGHKRPLAAPAAAAPAVPAVPAPPPPTTATDDEADFFKPGGDGDGNKSAQFYSNDADGSVATTVLGDGGGGGGGVGGSGWGSPASGAFDEPERWSSVDDDNNSGGGGGGGGASVAAAAAALSAAVLLERPDLESSNRSEFEEVRAQIMAGAGGVGDGQAASPGGGGGGGGGNRSFDVGEL